MGLFLLVFCITSKIIKIMFLVYLFLPYSNTDYQCIIPGLPNELSIYWHQYPYPFGEAFCKIRSFLSESASYANVLTILSFSLERYLAICRPLYVFPLSDLKRALLVSSLCWATAMLASVPHLIFTRYSKSSASF